MYNIINVKYVKKKINSGIFTYSIFMRTKKNIEMTPLLDVIDYYQIMWIN